MTAERMIEGLDVVRVLLAHGADAATCCAAGTSAVDVAGSGTAMFLQTCAFSPLHLAVERRDAERVAHCLACGLDPTAPGFRGLSAVDLATNSLANQGWVPRAVDGKTVGYITLATRHNYIGHNCIGISRWQLADGATLPTPSDGSCRFGSAGWLYSYGLYSYGRRQLPLRFHRLAI